MILPRKVYQMCVHGAYLVGSVAKHLAGDPNIEAHDYDLLVPLPKWQTIALLIPEDAKPNKFGGWRFSVEDQDGEQVEVDVWPDALENYLSQCRTKYGGRVVALDFINNRFYYSEIKEIENKNEGRET